MVRHTSRKSATKHRDAPPFPSHTRADRSRWRPHGGSSHDSQGQAPCLTYDRLVVMVAIRHEAALASPVVWRTFKQPPIIFVPVVHCPAFLVPSRLGVVHIIFSVLALATCEEGSVARLVRLGVG